MVHLNGDMSYFAMEFEGWRIMHRKSADGFDG